VRAIFVSLIALAAPALAAAASPQCPAKTVRRFDLEPIVVVPFLFGPQVADWSRDALARTPSELRPWLEERRAALSACYRWARGTAESLQGELAVSLEVDGWGVVTGATVESSDAALAKLAKCAEDALKRTRLASRFTPRTTRATLTIKLKPSGQPAPKKAPARPGAATPACTARTCVIQDLSQAPVDKLPLDPLELSDAAEEKNKKPKPVDAAAKALDPRIVGATVSYNLGAYRACWRKSLAEKADRTGTLDVSIEVDELGDICAVRFVRDPLRDNDLEGCLRTALSALWFEEPAPDGRLGIDFSLKLEPLPSDPPGPPSGDVKALDAWADDALERGDGAGAAQAYSQLLGGDAVNARRCQWIAGALQAEAIRNPWLDQKPHLAALAFAMFAEKNPVPDDCLTKAWPTFSAVTARMHSRAQRFPALWATSVDRFRTLSRAKLPPPKMADLRFYLAEALYGVHQMREAADHYGAAANLTTDAKLAETARYGRLLALKEAEQATETVWLEACQAVLEHPGADKERACAALKTCQGKVGDANLKALEKFAELCPPEAK
jgi:hypothetical protein